MILKYDILIFFNCIQTGIIIWSVLTSCYFTACYTIIVYFNIVIDFCIYAAFYDPIFDRVIWEMYLCTLTWIDKINWVIDCITVRRSIAFFIIHFFGGILIGHATVLICVWKKLFFSVFLVNIPNLIRVLDKIKIKIVCSRYIFSKYNIAGCYIAQIKAHM